MNKIKQSILNCIKKHREVTKFQIITELSNENSEKRILVQEAINLLLSNNSIFVVDRANTLALTEEGLKQLNPWYQKINWKNYIIKIFGYIFVFLLGMFTVEIKNIIISLFKK